MSRLFFEQVVDVAVGLLSPDLGVLSTRVTAINVKLWFDDADREHYEAQLLRDGRAEIGFHAEHRSAERNEAVLERLMAGETAWRKVLGDDAEGGDFLGGRGGPWRRLSETRRLRGTLDLDAAVDLGERLADYALALEPVRTGRA